MHSFTRSADTLPTLAGESGGAYDQDPADTGPTDAATRLLTAVDELEAARRAVLDAYRDAHAEGAVAATRGLSMDEFLALEGRLSRRDARRLQQLTTRLDALPVTAALLACGKISFDQASDIVAGTAPLNGTALATVEADAARSAAARNDRGDDPDVSGEVELLVQRHRRPRDVERRERRAIEGSSLTAQQDLDGGGLIVVNADAELFATTLAATEHAAGPPRKGTARRHQRAEGLRHVAAHWLAGTATSDGTSGTDDTATADDTATSDGIDTARDLAGPDDAVTAGPACDPFAASDRADRAQPTAADGAPARGSSAATAPARSTSDRDSAVVPPVTGRPTIRVIVDLADAVPAAFGQLLTGTGLAAAPHLSARLTDVLSCNADLLVQVNDGRRPLVELKDRQTIPAATRRSVIARDRRCRWPSCTAPISWADLHHILPRHLGGTHEPENLVGLCRSHHVRLHGRHWHATLDPTTAAFSLARSAGGPPVHVTYPHGAHPPGVAAPR